MSKSLSKTFAELLLVLRYLLRWLPIAVLAGMLGGTASAVLLVSLNWATDTREAHHWLIALLPVAGLLVGLMYHYLGTAVEAGNNLVLDEVHDPKRTIPVRMTPLILIGTFMTHLFGGSAGREGTAIQTGASLADQLGKPFRMDARERRVLLMAGISAGFASVFGTPLAGAVFGLEVLAIGAVGYDAIVPCFVAAFIGDLTTHAWGVHHTLYQVRELPVMSVPGLAWAAIAGAAFGLVGMSFAKLTHSIGHLFKKYIAWSPLRPFVGGIVVAGTVFALGSTKYIGLGIPTILDAFGPRHDPQDWLLKLLFTAVTLALASKAEKSHRCSSSVQRSGTPLHTSCRCRHRCSPAWASSQCLREPPTRRSLRRSWRSNSSELKRVRTLLWLACSAICSPDTPASTRRNGLVAASTTKMPRKRVSHWPWSPRCATCRSLPARRQKSRRSIPKPKAGGSSMNELVILRLYFSAAEMRKADGWWRRLAPQSLGEYLLRQAKGAGVEQALLHRVIGGYLKDHALAMDTEEMPNPRLPQCLELVGTNASLQDFLRENREHLQSVRTVFLRGEEARIEAALDREELQQSFKMKEQSESEQDV